MGARISCAYAGVNVHPKVFEGDRKALIQNRRRQPTPFNRTKAIILHSVKIEPRSSLLEKPFRLFFVQSIEKFFSLPHISRQTASGLRKDRPGFSKGRPLLQVAPLEKSVHRTLFSIHPCRAPPWAGDFAACGLRPGAPPLGSLRAFEKARPKLLIPWRIIIALLRKRTLQLFSKVHAVCN